MKNEKHFFSILLILFFTVNSTAQEVFFKDNTTHLKTVNPSYYYPLKNGSHLQEFMTKNAANNMRILDATEVSSPDRFTNNGEALGLNGNSGYISPPDAIFNEMINNKVVNMSFWVKYTDEVYNGTKEGVILKIAPKATGSSSKLYVAIKKGKFIMYAMRPKVTGGEVLVPVIKVDFPLDWGSYKPGSDTNGFIYISINAIGKDVKKTLISFGRPGGRLYSRSYYTYPFENISTQNDTLLMFGGKLGGDQVKADRIDDIMFFTKNEYANRIFTPEEVLNNFYLQSPLYEGVSYEIAGNGENVGFWGLDTQKNRGVDGGTDYDEVKLGNDDSKTPFGYNRFMIYRNFENPSVFRFSSIKAGGFFADSDINAGVYHIFNESYFLNSTYVRDVSNPTTMYSIGSSQFRIRDVNSYYTVTKRINNVDVLAGYYGNTPDEKRSLFGVTAAVKVIRGEARDYPGLVNLRNRSRKPEGENLTYVSNMEDRFIGFGSTGLRWELNPTINDNYVTNRIRTELIPEGMGKLLGCEDLSEYIPIIVWSTYCDWEFIYVKDDVNGKPLYWLRLKEGAKEPMSAVIPNGQIHLNQVYKDVLQDDGTLLDRLLWSIHKAD